MSLNERGTVTTQAPVIPEVFADFRQFPGDENSPFIWRHCEDAFRYLIQSRLIDLSMD